MHSFFSGSSAAVFKEAPNKQGSIRDMGRIPKVLFTSEVMFRQWLFVNNCEKEIGWLGISKRLPTGDILVEKVILFEQEVSATTTVISAEGLANVAMNMIDEGCEHELDLLRFWGHSHVEMDVSPSGQDETQMKEFEENGAEYFIRAIFNKKGAVRIDIFDYVRQLVFVDVGWSVQTPDEDDATTREVKESISKLVKQRSAPVYRQKYAYGSGYTPIVEPATFGEAPSAESLESSANVDSSPIVLSPNTKPGNRKAPKHGR